MKTIYMADCTLREATHSLLFREKVAMVKVIGALGVNAIELPPVKNAKEDAVINKTIASVLQDVTLTLPAGETEEDVAVAWSCIKDASSPRLQIALPVSTVQMEYMYRLKNAGMLDKIAALVKAAKALAPSVEFAALDAARAERSFLVEACKVAAQNGADVITLSDSTGEMLPEDCAMLVEDVRTAVIGTLLLQISDKLGLATAAALAGLTSGADGVKTCIDGKEQLLTERFTAAVKSLGDSLNLASAIDDTAIHTDTAALLKSLHGSDSYTEAQAAAGTVLLDSDSTLTQVKDAAFSLGYDLSEEDVGRVLESVKAICESRSSVGGRELEAIIASTAMQVPSTYHLDCYTASTGSGTLAVSQVTLLRDGEKISGVASGDGPIDAAFRALESCIGHHYELDDFQIQSVTEGKGALGSALVRLRHRGKLYSGNGLSTDIVGSSIRAYINALNKIVYED
ncbi:MAG: hypothetical protein IJU16_08710 [Clostridia bacterium]|nr:hypothetical protein [Clostridia bacterium]